MRSPGSTPRSSSPREISSTRSYTSLHGRSCQAPSRQASGPPPPRPPRGAWGNGCPSGGVPTAAGAPSTSRSIAPAEAAVNPLPSAAMRGLEERRVVVDGVSVNACVAGEGPPIVLIHGLAGSWRYWYPPIEALRDRFRLVALDVPGSGHSEVAADPFSLDRAGDVLLAAWEELGASQPLLVGHSLGGALATALAADHGGRISRLALVSPPGFGVRPA